MALSENYGVNLGRTLLQQSGSIGGKRYVFVKQGGGAKNQLVFPTFGCKMLNPFPSNAKVYAGDLVEYRTDGTGYILKTYEVAKRTSGGSDVDIYLKRDGYHHIPFVGDILMKAPKTLETKGAAYKVTNVVKDIQDGADVWKVTLATTLGTLEVGDVLVEGNGAGASQFMLVKNPNMVLPWDMDFLFEPATGDEDYDGARYIFDPVLSSLAYVNRMSPIPPCVMALNKSRVVGWFQI